MLDVRCLTTLMGSWVSSTGGMAGKHDHRHGGTYRPRQNSLVKALTGVDTDRLPEEKRGMSIDLGFAYHPPSGQVLGFVDVPGHERFIRKARRCNRHRLCLTDCGGRRRTDAANRGTSGYS